MQPDVAARILRRGMEQGWFTGVTLAACLPAVGPATRAAFVHARTIVNGTDRDDAVADHAHAFAAAFLSGGVA
jgi:putative chitinase